MTPRFESDGYAFEVKADGGNVCDRFRLRFSLNDGFVGVSPDEPEQWSSWLLARVASLAGDLSKVLPEKGASGEEGSFIFHLLVLKGAEEMGVISIELMPRFVFFDLYGPWAEDESRVEVEARRWERALIRALDSAPRDFRTCCVCVDDPGAQSEPEKQYGYWDQRLLGGGHRRRPFFLFEGFCFELHWDQDNIHVEIDEAGARRLRFDFYADPLYWDEIPSEYQLQPSWLLARVARLVGGRDLALVLPETGAFCDGGNFVFHLLVTTDRVLIGLATFQLSPGFVSLQIEPVWDGDEARTASRARTYELALVMALSESMDDVAPCRVTVEDPEDQAHAAQEYGYRDGKFLGGPRPLL